MAIHITTRATYGTLTVSEVDVTDPIMQWGRQIGTTHRPGWNVDCDRCAEPVATLLDAEPDETAVSAMGHVCATDTTGERDR